MVPYDSALNPSTPSAQSYCGKTVITEVVLGIVVTLHDDGEVAFRIWVGEVPWFQLSSSVYLYSWNSVVKSIKTDATTLNDVPQLIQ